MKKICFIVEATIGGVERHLTDLIDGIKDKYEIMLIYSNLRDAKFKDRINERFGRSIKLINMDMKRNVSLYDFVPFLRIYFAIKKEKPDIVHCHSSKAGLVGRAAAKIAGVKKIIYTPHAWAFYQASGIRKRIYILAERMLGKITDRIIAVSEAERKEGLRNKIIPREGFEVIHNGVNLERFDADKFSKEKIIEERKKIGFNERDIIIGMFGRLSREKNVFFLLESADKIIKKAKNVKFLIVGEGGLKDKIEERIKKHGGEEIVLLGWQNDIEKFYTMADIYANVSKYEGLPYGVMEAMAMKKPIVATSIAGTKELIINGRNGFLADNKDEFAEDILRLAKDEKLRESMGEEGRKIIINNFGLNEMINKHCEAYDGI